MKKSQIIFFILILIIILIVIVYAYYAYKDAAESYSSSSIEAIEKRFNKEVDQLIYLFNGPEEGRGIVITKDKKMYGFHIEYNKNFGSRVNEISTGIDLDEMESNNFLYSTLFMADNTVVVYGITSVPNAQSIYINGLKGRMVDFAFYFNHYMEYGEGKRFWVLETDYYIFPEVFLIKDSENNITEKYIYGW